MCQQASAETIAAGHLESNIQIIRKVITDEMVVAGLEADNRADNAREGGARITDSDLVCQIYAAMRRLEGNPLHHHVSRT